jgi:hypothetical protein
LEKKLTNLNSPTNDDVDKAIKSFQPSDIPAFSLAPQLGLINKCFSANTYEGILEKLSQDGSDFAKTLLKDLDKMVSLYSVFELSLFSCYKKFFVHDTKREINRIAYIFMHYFIISESLIVKDYFPSDQRRQEITIFRSISYRVQNGLALLC